MEAGGGDSERSRPGHPLQGQPGHGAQGDRRVGGQQPAGAASGQGNLRRDARRRDDAVSLSAPGARYAARCGAARAARAAVAALSRLPAPARAGRCRARDRPARRRSGTAGAPPVVLSQPPGRARRNLAVCRAVQGADLESLVGLPGPDVRPVRDRVRRAHGARRGTDPGRRRRAWRGRVAARWRRVCRCCRSNGWPTPTAIVRSNCVVACTTRPRTTIATSWADPRLAVSAAVRQLPPVTDRRSWSPQSRSLSHHPPPTRYRAHTLRRLQKSGHKRKTHAQQVLVDRRGGDAGAGCRGRRGDHGRQAGQGRCWGASQEGQGRQARGDARVHCTGSRGADADQPCRR